MKVQLFTEDYYNGSICVKLLSCGSLSQDWQVGGLELTAVTFSLMDSFVTELDFHRIPVYLYF